MLVAATRGVLRSAVDWLQSLGGAPVARATPDRELLEQTILPALAGRADVGRVLFVGCAPYTRHYEALFAGAEYWTIDPSPRRRACGARRHIEDRLEHLRRHVPAAYFDAIVCNGVLGWGIDTPAAAEAAFAACRAALRPGGDLVLGWNDVRPHNAVTPGAIASLRRFEAVAWPDVGGPQLRADGPRRHVFEFYRRPASSAAGQGASTVGAGAPGAHADIGRQRPSMHSS